MKCPNCGKETVEGAKFCGSCGAPLASALETEAAPQPQTQAEQQPQTVPAQPASPFDATSKTGPAVQAAPQPPTPAGYAPYEPPVQPANPQQAAYAQPDPNAQQGYYQQPQGQQPFAQPVPPYGQAGYQPGYVAATYPVSETDRVLRMINFILCLISTIACGIAIIPLCWMIPMTVISWGIYKGKKANTVAFDVCTLLFVNIIGGVLLLCSNKDIKQR